MGQPWGDHSSGSCMVPSLSASARCAWMSLDRKSTCRAGGETGWGTAAGVDKDVKGLQVPCTQGRHCGRHSRGWLLNSPVFPAPVALLFPLLAVDCVPPAPPHQRAVVLLVGQHLLKVGLGEVRHGGHCIRQVPPHRGVALLLAGLQGWGRTGW